jgi:hypothetical protein
MKTIKDIEIEFFKKNHWLICDCDLGEEIKCKMAPIFPAFRQALKKVENIVKKEFINGERCFSCGCKKEKNLADTCNKCFEIK